MLRRKFVCCAWISALLLCTILLSGGVLQGQTDPGPRPVGIDNPALAICPPAAPPEPELASAKFPFAPPCIDTVQPPPDPNNVTSGAGNVLLHAGNQSALWFEALTVFETKAVVGPVAQTGGATFPGLGPGFNGLSCFQCHSQPTVGGSSPGLTQGVETPGFPHGNPQTQLQSTIGANGIAPTQAQLTPLVISPADTTLLPILATDSAGNGIGPVREVRFPQGFGGNPTNFIDPIRAGEVAELYVVTLNIGAPTACSINQFPFQDQQKAGNVVFRIPIPTFGEGLIENTDDQTLIRNAGNAKTLATNLGITDVKFAHFNSNGNLVGFDASGNDQTISRFGWKAQHKSMLIFASDASNVEMGVTNENFPDEMLHGNNQCAPNFEPEDEVVVPPIMIAQLNDPRTIQDLLTGTGPGEGSPAPVASVISSNIENFAVFMRLNAPPSQCAYNSGLDRNGFARCFSLTCSRADQTAGRCSVPNPNPDADAVASIKRGKKLFGSLDPTVAGLGTSALADTDVVTSGITTVGCVLCHSDFLTTTTSRADSLNAANFHPFSDFALHTMDNQLADGVTEGQATGQQFRSAPLWGIGQRLFFMHDGRENNLLNAIEDHCLPTLTTMGTTPSQASEACTVIGNFKKLPTVPPKGCSGSSCASQQDVLRFLRSL